MKKFGGSKRIWNSPLASLEKKYIDWLVPHIGFFFETFELTWLTLFWSLLIIVFGFLAKNNTLWLIGSSIAIILQYFTDHFDGAIGKHKKTGLVKWGFFMDHFLDFVFMCSVIFGYSFLLDESQLHVALITFAIFSGFMINSFLEFPATNILRISYFKISPTEVRIGFILLNIAIMLFGAAMLPTLFFYLNLFSAVALVLVVRSTQKRLWALDIKERKIHPSTISKHTLNKRYRLFRLKYLLFLTAAFFAYINFYVYITNPFHRFTVVKAPFTTTVENNQIVLHKAFSLNIGESSFQNAFAYYKSAVHILANTYLGSIPAKSTTENGIIAEIHALRFNPAKPYLISGDHFSVLYPRNLGIFYKDMLNPNTALNKNDWINRQRIYLQTTAYALETFSNAHNLYTTIVPIGVHTVTPINIYAYPSDSLYGIFYALDSMENSPYPSATSYKLQTADAAKQLVYSYKDSLQELLGTYSDTVFDTRTGLIRKDIHLSSTRDAAIRESSFYDNVIYWKTLQLADKLGIKHFESGYLDNLKQRIIKNFWYEDGGYFLDDLSVQTLKSKDYSSDWLIAVSTGFLDTNDPSERLYAEQSVAYIKQHSLDKPFGLRYRKASDTSKEFAFVRYFVPSYGGSAIWSYWGMEYVRTLIELYKQTDNLDYLQTAKENLNAYAQNIVLYRGFPEVYSEKGKFLENFVYKSIRQTGWVVEYENMKWLLQKVQKIAIE